jgi:cobalt-zinc-cadmium efflux system protein
VCLEDWSDEMKEAGDHKARWHERMAQRGLRVKLAVDDAGAVGGMIQYLPIEEFFVEGRGLYMILCIWVHGHKQGRGDFRRRGMGSAHRPPGDARIGIRTAFFLNLAFAVIEVAGGLLTNSLAILSDALHDAGDSLSIAFSWYMESRARWPGSGSYSYGFRRLSLLAAVVNAIVLIAGSGAVLAMAIPRLAHPQHAHAQGMLALALLGIAVNGAAALRLRGGKTMNARVIAWHPIEDLLGWAAVLIVSLALLVADIHLLDPLLSILITAYVLFNVARNLRKTIALFLQAAPPDLDVAAVERALAAIPHVLSTHHTHAWSLYGEHHVVTTHLLVPAAATKADVMAVKAAALRLMDQVDLEHTTIEVEYEDETCRMRDG